MFDVRFESQSNLNEVIDVTGRKTKMDSTPAGKRFKNHLKSYDGRRFVYARKALGLSNLRNSSNRNSYKMMVGQKQDDQTTFKDRHKVINFSLEISTNAIFFK